MSFKLNILILNFFKKRKLFSSLQIATSDEQRVETNSILNDLAESILNIFIVFGYNDTLRSFCLPCLICKFSGKFSLIHVYLRFFHSFMHIKNVMMDVVDIQRRKISANEARCNESSFKKTNDPILKCPKAFVLILCWDETVAGTTAVQDCPTWFIGFEYSKGKVTRKCLENGMWQLKANSTYLTYSNYTDCYKDLTQNQETLAVRKN